MFNFFKSSETTNFWKDISTENELEQAIYRSEQKPVVLFKHSTRCSISSMAKNRLESNYHEGLADFYYLDLIEHRSISNAIADQFDVEHQSPQILVLVNGSCIYHASHGSISFDAVKQAVKG